MVAQCNNVTF